MQIVFGLLFLLFFSACCLCVAACTRFDAALLPLPALCGSVVVLYLLSLLGLLQFGHFIIMAVWLAGGVYFGVRAGWRAIRRALFSPGFLLFVGGSCFLWVLFALQQPMLPSGMNLPPGAWPPRWWRSVLRCMWRIPST